MRFLAARNVIALEMGFISSARGTGKGKGGKSPEDRRLVRSARRTSNY